MYSLRISVTALVTFAALFVLAFAPVSKADGVTYTFTGVNNSHNDDQLSVAFTYTAPGFLLPTAPGTFISLFPSQLDSCTNCLMSSVCTGRFFLHARPCFWRPDPVQRQSELRLCIHVPARRL